MTLGANISMSLALAALALSAALWTHDSMYVAVFAVSAALFVLFLLAGGGAASELERFCNCGFG